MRKILFTIFFIVAFISVKAQELNCKVVVNADQILDVNPQVFKTLESAINDFMNQTVWTDVKYAPEEKISCSLILTLNEKAGNDTYSGTIQVQSSRPVFNSVYNTPVLNYRDEDLSFTYMEFEPLRFDTSAYQSELVSTLSYFAYLVLGLDADTFSLNGGDSYFAVCQKIVDQVENPNSKKAWKSNTNKLNRYIFLNKLISPALKTYRATLYQYHLYGLDQMSQETGFAKENVLTSLLDLSRLSQDNYASQIIRTFMDAKSDEIVDIFSAGPIMDTADLVDALNKMAPTFAHKWEKIK